MIFEVSPDLQNWYHFAGEKFSDNHAGMKVPSIDVCIKIMDNFTSYRKS